MPPTPKLKMSNEQFAQRRKAAQAIQRGQQPAMGPAAFQQQGATESAIAGQSRGQVAMQQAGQQVEQAQNQAAMQQIQKQEQRQMSEIEARQKHADQKRKLEKFAMETGNSMMAERRQFERKSKNQRFANERQLADWTVANAKNEQELQNRFQTMQQAAEKQIQVLEMINNRIIAEEKRISTGKMNAKTRAQKIRLARIKKAMNDKIRREKEKARKRGGVIQMATGALTTAAGVGLIVAGATSPVPNPTLIGLGASTAAGGFGQMASGANEAEVI